MDIQGKYCFNCFKQLGGNTVTCPYCGFEPSWNNSFHSALPMGSILGGNYIVGRVLGQGGFGITYVAYDYRHNRKVAVKEYFPQSIMGQRTHTVNVSVSGSQKRQIYEDGIDAFIGEAKILSRFSSHPNIVTIYECFRENATAYYVMEYIGGRNLKSHVKSSGGKIPWQEALEYIMPIVNALLEVHKKGLIHRDVTPDNIYLMGNGGVKLLDFGSARYSIGDKTQTLDILLKRGYAPKEQYMSKSRQGPYTDIYSLAATFYAVVTGYIPPDAMDRIDHDKLIPMHILCPQIPSEVEKVIHKALSINYENRYKNMSEFRAALEKAANLKRYVPKEEKAAPIGKNTNNTDANDNVKQDNKNTQEEVKTNVNTSTHSKSEIIKTMKYLRSVFIVLFAIVFCLKSSIEYSLWLGMLAIIGVLLVGTVFYAKKLEDEENKK
ncbi:MAG: serine/threonine protein kinase [Clostridia bacterium]|nr:serine/threonine protein kinase [Clostridia bacterium]